jgi:hypothetical protein
MLFPAPPGNQAISHLNASHVELAGRVRQVAVPSAARTFSTLSHIDYEDAFLLGIGFTQDRTAEQWARAVLEDAPIIARRALPRLLSAIGLQLGPTQSGRFVLGWEVRRATPDYVLLAARSSRIGLSAELLFKRQQQTLLYVTFVQQEKAIARVVWAGLAPAHRQVVRYLAADFVRRERYR